MEGCGWPKAKRCKFAKVKLMQWMNSTKYKILQPMCVSKLKIFIGKASCGANVVSHGGDQDHHA